MTLPSLFTVILDLPAPAKAGDPGSMNAALASLAIQGSCWGGRPPCGIFVPE